MSDIVERLRELEAVESELACECDCPPEATANYRYAMTCADAADEIERLKAALDEAQQAFALESYNAKRLRAALEWIAETALTEPETMVAKARAALKEEGK